METRFISQPRRMMALGCASEIALAAASNSPSCMPSATSASGVPFTVSGTDQTTLRAGLSFFQMPGTQLNSGEIVPCRSGRRSRRPAPTTAPGSAIFPRSASVRSRPSGPQLTNAPANFEEFEGDARRGICLATGRTHSAESQGRRTTASRYHAVIGRDSSTRSPARSISPEAVCARQVSRHAPSAKADTPDSPAVPKRPGAAAFAPLARQNPAGNAPLSSRPHASPDFRHCAHPSLQ